MSIVECHLINFEEDKDRCDSILAFDYFGNKQYLNSELSNGISFSMYKLVRHVFIIVACEEFSIDITYL